MLDSSVRLFGCEPPVSGSGQKEREGFPLFARFQTDRVGGRLAPSNPLKQIRLLARLSRGWAILGKNSPSGRGRTTMTAWLFRSAVVGFLMALLVIGPPAYAQQQGQSQDSSQSATQTPRQAPPPVSFRLSDAPDYSKGKRPFPNLLSPYAPITVPEPVLTNSPRIDQLIHDGKLMLSLSDAISLALENNLDISIQRFVPWILETDILRTRAGGAARGIGGTGTASALGAIPVATFDPIVTVNLNTQHATIPVNNPFTSGTGSTGLT